MSRLYITIAVAGFVVGIGLESFLDSGLSLALLGILLATCYILLIRAYRLTLVVVFFLALAVGVLRFDLGPLPPHSFPSLVAVKDAFVGNVNRMLPEPHAALVNGITVGERGLPREVVNEFRRTGVSHIVVLSGYNLSVVAKVLSPIGTLGGLAGIILFTLMTGAEASAVRAAIMALVIILAKATGRVYDAAVALVAAGLLMLLYDPTLLAFSLSFQLSFLATAGILFLDAPIKKRLTRVPEGPKWFPVRETLATTLAAQAAVLPLLIYTFGNLSLVSIPVNVLILPAVPPLMALGFATGIIGFLSTSLAQPFAWASYVLLSYILTLVHLFAGLPFAQISF